jgi:glycosyltransferase involved in cell wall biosynthesis
VAASRHTGSPRLTYLVAMFDQEPWVGDCLRSLQVQTDPRWLALVLDDASRDGSARIVRGWPDPRVRLIEGRENRGYIAALERLIDEAPTDLVAILDPDDALHPEATALLLEAFEDPDVGFVHSFCDAFDGDWSEFRGRHPRKPALPGQSALLDRMVLHIRAFRRDVYRKTQGLDPSMRYAEDRDLIFKLEEVTRFGFVPRPLYRYRLLAHSQSHDARKKELGARNHWRARRAALRRRRIRGLPRLARELSFLALYLNFSDRWPRLRRAAGPALGRLARRARTRWPA